MTTVQVAYAEHLEQGRHNVATEQEANRHNVVTEAEQGRSNLENERIKRASNKIERSKVKETKRYNKVQERQKDRELTERERANRASEANSRHATDTNASTAIQTAQIQADSHVAAATIAANVSKEIAVLNDWREKLKTDAANARNANDNATAKAIAKANNYVKEAIASADRLQRAYEASNHHEVDSAMVEIQRIRNQIQKDYNNGKLKIEAYEAIIGTLDDLMAAAKTAAAALAAG